MSDPLGTYVAGVVAASRGNAVGIAGVDDTVRLLPVRVFAEGTGSEIAVAAGIVWAVDNDADVVLVPLQYYGGSQALQDAVAYAYAQGVLVIAPTGKQGYSSLAYPAAFDGCLAIAATTNRDERADFSNYGVGGGLSRTGLECSFHLAARYLCKSGGGVELGRCHGGRGLRRWSCRTRRG